MLLILQKEKNQHFHYLRNNKHPNIHLQRAFNKHKEINFKFEIVELCENNELIIKEQYYIDILKPNFNICQIAGSSIGRKATKETIIKMKISHSKRNCKHTEETKIKLSISHKGKSISKEHKEKIKNTLSIPIIQLDKNDNFIKEFSSVTEAIKMFNNNTGIVGVLKGKRITASNFKWKYKNI